MSPKFKNSNQSQTEHDSGLSTFQIMLWITSLAMLAVGVRNFEDGMSIDAPVYASIARNIAKTGEWFFMYANVPDWIPFAEHPHLGFWLQALIFKILPAADWSARILGHASYLANLFFVFKIAEHFFNRKAAVVAVLLLWTWPVFSNFHSTFYLDGPTLAFGLGFLISLYKALNHEKKKLLWAATAGACLGLAALTKGLTFLVFGPTAAVIFFASTYESLSKEKLKPAIIRNFSLSLATLTVTSVILGLYYLAIKNSSAPNFLDIYIDRQFTGRFQQSWNWSKLWNPTFWKRLSQDTNWLIPLLPIAVFSLRKQKGMLIVLSFFLSALFMYAPALRLGGQYWLLLMPPAAILLGGALSISRLSHKINETKTINFTRNAAICLVLLVQYLPYRTHTSRYPDITPFIDKLKESGSINHLIVSGPEKQQDFITLGTFGWYPDLPLNYLEEELLLSYTGTPIPLVEQVPHNIFRLETTKSAVFHFSDKDGSNLPYNLKEFIAITPSGTQITYCLIQYLERSALYVPKSSSAPYSCVK